RAFGMQFVRERTRLVKGDELLLGDGDLSRRCRHPAVADDDVAVRDELTGLFRRVRQPFTIDYGLQATFENVGHFETQHVVDTVVLGENPEPSEPAEERLALALGLVGIALGVAEQSSCLTAETAKLGLGTPEFFLVRQAVAPNEVRLLGDALALEGMVRRLVTFGVGAEGHSTRPPPPLPSLPAALRRSRRWYPPSGRWIWCADHGPSGRARGARPCMS